MQVSERGPEAEPQQEYPEADAFCVFRSWILSVVLQFRNLISFVVILQLHFVTYAHSYSRVTRLIECQHIVTTGFINENIQCEHLSRSVVTQSRGRALVLVAVWETKSPEADAFCILEVEFWALCYMNLKILILSWFGMIQQQSRG